MAQPFLLSMEHSEWHARNVLKKFHKNRPLGRIHQHHKFNPPQPVLSCRTVDIDVTGTRTYRPVSNRDIIEEQHRLIHEIYSKARSVSAAAIERPQSTIRVDNEGRSLSALQVHGQYPGSRASSRNSSQPQSRDSRPSSSRSSKKTGFIVLKVRPHTTGSRKREVLPATETRLSVESDPALDQSNHAYRSSSQLIRQTREPENRTLDQGKFVRGKKDGPSVSTNMDQKSSHQWMTFGGGQKERSAGVVDAFTSTKEDKYFTIDGSTGTLVAKQLQRGDQIRVGRNGEVREPGSSQLAWTEDRHSPEKIEEPDKPKPQILPLSWEEQVATMNAKVIEATGQKPSKQIINLCETHPVVFKKFGEDGMKPPPVEQEPKVKVKEGYNIKRRTAERIGIDGKSERPSAKVTHISVGKEDAGDVPDVKYEDVLDMKIKSKGAKGPHVHEEVAKATQSLGRQGGSRVGSATGDQQQHPHKQQQRQKLKSISKTSIASEGDSARGGGGGATRLHSSSLVLNNNSSSQQQTDAAGTELNGIVLAPRSSPVNPPIHTVSARSDNGTGRNGSDALKKATTSSSSSLATKSSGQSRPPPAKPVLHKTSAATGSSISKNNTGEETEFIHFSQQLSINREGLAGQGEPKTRVSSAGASRQHSAAAIESVTEHNKPPTKDVTFKEEVEIAEVVIQGGEGGGSQYGEEDPNRSYAFNIPTAEEDEYPQSP